MYILKTLKLDVMNKDFGFPTKAFVEICYHLKNEWFYLRGFD